MNMDTFPDLIGRMILLKKEHEELYQSGLLNVGTDSGIQVTDDLFALIPGKTQKKLRKSTEYPYEYSKVFNGERFFIVTDEKKEC